MPLRALIAARPEGRLLGGPGGPGVKVLALTLALDAQGGRCRTVMEEEWRERDRRPSPDAPWARARRERGGGLKIFRGAAPGGCKICEMLTTARARHRDGLAVGASAGIPVREAVPASTLDRGEALMQRLREGEVYRPRPVERALGHGLSPELPVPDKAA
ncbi:hypothetical protein [Methylobacterium nodulans]|uniref:hypothetical protein n=1 Tax=Methylobacterium nodulans TaxID=114616 RepID=UPI0001619232|nr:hypothetical protein [Methylobacterium nodulans]